jgi:hypothetical protein
MNKAEMDQEGAEIYQEESEAFVLEEEIKPQWRTFSVTLPTTPYPDRC